LSNVLEIVYSILLFSSWFIPYFVETNKAVEILFGGAGSGKSVHSAMKDIKRVHDEDENVLVVRKRYNSLIDSYYAELKSACTAFGYDEDFIFTKSPLKITCKTNNKVILFRGLDDVEKVKSIRPANGSIDHVTIEEATEIDEADLGQLQFRMRGGGDRLSLDEIEQVKEMIDKGALKVDIYEALSFLSGEDIEADTKTLTILFNPINKEHWIYERFFKGKWSEDKSIYEDENLYINKSTHWNNQYLTVDDHLRYESYKDIDPYLYDVYTCGNWGVLGDVVFRNWKVVDLSKAIKAFDIFDHGLDWGYTDPFAYSMVGHHEGKRSKYIFKEDGESGLPTELIAARVHPFIDRDAVWCDSAEPDRIQKFIDLGIDARGVYKGKKNGLGAKRLTIEHINTYTTYVDYRCVNTIKALSCTVWKKDSNGKKLWEPADNEFDHWGDSYIYSQTHRAITRGGVISHG